MIQRDVQILRSLASQVKEIAQSPQNLEKAKAWQSHNDLEKGARPMVFCDPENGWKEIIPQKSLECEGDLARSYEFFFRKELFSALVLKDDRVLDDCVLQKSPFLKSFKASDCTKIEQLLRVLWF